MSLALKEQTEILEQVENAMLLQLKATQATYRQVSDGMIMPSCARIIGKVMAVQQLPAAMKEKLLLDVHKTMQHHAGLNIHGGMLDG